MSKLNSEQQELLIRVLSEELPEDHPEFQKWLAECEENRDFYARLKDDGNEYNQIFDLDNMYQNISITFKEDNRMHKSSFTIPVWLKYASVILLFTIPTSLILWINESGTNDIGRAYEPHSNNIELSCKKAKLTLADGRTLNLEGEFNMDDGNGTHIVNERAKGLSYEKNIGSKTVEYHTLEVPYGGEYELKLSDGTKVYLNSGSRITYPSSFTGTERKVELTGEAYFNVARDTLQFIVHTNNIDVRVFGTSFNICAYEGDSQINTTLVSGEVKVYTLHNDSVYNLIPGDNLNYKTETRGVSKKQVDTNLYIAWTKGEFIFRNQTIGDILTQLSRWYDFQVEYTEQSIRDLRFTGSAEKKNPISHLLKQIESVTNLKIKQYGNIITIYR